MSRRFAAALIGIALAVLPSAVLAGPPGEWTEFTSHDVYNFAYHGYERTADGVLHVAWNDPGHTDDETRGLYHTAFNADGTVGITNKIVTGGGEGDIVLAPNGTLRVFFAGLVVDEPDNLGTATAPATGDGWTVTRSNVVDGDAAYASNIGAAVASDGTFFQAWGYYVHRGLSPSTDNHDYQTPFGCCAYDPRLVVDQQTGQMYRVWYSNGSGNTGLLIQEVNTSSGAPIGTAMDVPGVEEVGGTYDGDSSPMTGKPQVSHVPEQAGVYVAYHGGYPSSGRVILWRVGDAEATVLHDGGSTDYDVAMDVGPDGRIWVFWATRSTTEDNKIYYRVSDPARTSWTPVASVVRPPTQQEFHTLYSLATDAQADRADLFAHISSGGTSDPYESTWHTQVLAPIEGTEGDDTIEGTEANEVILGGAGNDKIDGGGGNDVIIGGVGNDVMSGGAGTDKIQGGAGSDNLNGGPQVDPMNGGPGKDTCVYSSKKELKRDKSCEKKKLNFKLNFWPYKQPL